MRPFSRPFSIAVFGLAIAASGSASAAVADAGQGETIARRWCAACHVVANDQKQANADVASFAAAARHKTNGELAAFLTDPHPKMPDMSLTREEIADIVAYMRSLAPEGPKGP
jgi:mono/diheme cytochrome c family protein